MASPIGSTGLNRKYLRLEDLRRLQHFLFVSRRMVEGQYAGRHATPQRGQSVEFRDYRQYLPGDDLGAVDWKVYGRTDRLVIKVFEHQAAMTVSLLVDGSSSMGFRGMTGMGASKYDQACRLAAAIAFLVANQQDRVGYGVAQDGLKSHHRPTTSLERVAGILQVMEQTVPRGKADLGEALRDLAVASPRRGLFIVVSDLLEDPAQIIKSLTACVQGGGEAIVFHVLHAEELSLPDMDQGVFVDSETGERVRLHIGDVRHDYEDRMKQFVDDWRKRCTGRGIDYQLVSTAEPYHRALEHFMFHRATMR